MIKYSYATCKGLPLHIDDVTEEMRSSNHFHCIVCKKRVVAHINGKKQRHFKHYDYEEHDYETYLHRAAKAIFYTAYRNAIETDQSVEILVGLEVHECDKLSNFIRRNCSYDNAFKSINLTNKYRGIEIEKQVGSLRPDILLWSESDMEDFIFIEFFVTHRCSPEKIQSKNRIIEIQITSEDDLVYLKDLPLSLQSLQIKRYNFQTTKIVRDFCKEANIPCKILVDYAVIFKDGTYNIFQNNAEEAYANIFFHLKDVALYIVREARSDDARHAKHLIWQHLMSELRSKKINLRSCLSCKYWQLSYYQPDSERFIWCSALKRRCTPLKALDCHKFEEEKYRY